MSDIQLGQSEILWLIPSPPKHYSRLIAGLLPQLFPSALVFCMPLGSPQSWPIFLLFLSDVRHYRVSYLTPLRQFHQLFMTRRTEVFVGAPVWFHLSTVLAYHFVVLFGGHYHHLQPQQSEEDKSEADSQSRCLNNGENDFLVLV